MIKFSKSALQLPMEGALVVPVHSMPPVLHIMNGRVHKLSIIHKII